MMVSAAMGFGGINLLSTALAAACLGFLVWNFYPAKVFMGDTGSMFLGGMVTGLAFGVGMPLILAFLGIIYICGIHVGGAAGHLLQDHRQADLQNEPYPSSF